MAHNDLYKLIYNWRKKAQKLDEATHPEGCSAWVSRRGRANSLRECADELHALIKKGES